jgi:hypothetical protein
MKVIQLILLICAAVVWLPEDSPAASTAYVVIENKTGGTVHYELEWEGTHSPLKDFYVQPGSYEWHRYTYYTNSSPRPRVVFHLHEGVASYELPWVGFGNQPRRYSILAVNPGSVSWNPPL